MSFFAISMACLARSQADFFVLSASAAAPFSLARTPGFGAANFGLVRFRRERRLLRALAVSSPEILNFRVAPLLGWLLAATAGAGATEDEA